MTIEVDEPGEIHVEAADKRSGKSESTIIYKYNRHRLSPEEMDQKIREAEGQPETSWCRT